MTVRSVALVVSAAALVAACGSSDHFQVRSAADGRVLADPRGRTLYFYSADSPGRSNCYGLCAQKYPPLAAAPSGRPFGKWTIIARDDRGRQWSYDGKAVYTFSGDTRPGDAQGIDAEWSIARP